MKKIISINSFSAIDDNGTIVSDLFIGNEIKFKSRTKKKCICFQFDRKENCFDLIFYKRDEIKQFQLRENKYFNKKYIKELSEEFSFDLINDPIHPEFLRGSLVELESSYSLPLMGGIKRTKDSFFLIIFANRGETEHEENITYIHGIWKVELPKELKGAFFNSFTEPAPQ